MWRTVRHGIYSSMISTVGHYSCSVVLIYFVLRFKVQADTTICQQPLCRSTGHIRRRTVIHPHRRNETSPHHPHSGFRVRSVVILVARAVRV